MGKKHWKDEIQPLSRRTMTTTRRSQIRTTSGTEGGQARTRRHTRTSRIGEGGGTNNETRINVLDLKTIEHLLAAIEARPGGVRQRMRGATSLARAQLIDVVAKFGR